jgi:hypothetical protein
MIEHSRNISLAARDLWVGVEKQISAIGKSFTSTMEVNHFLMEFCMYAAIQLGCEMGARDTPTQDEERNDEGVQSDAG